MHKEEEFNQVQQSDRLLNQIHDKLDSSIVKKQVMVQNTSEKAKKFNDLAVEKSFEYKEQYDLLEKEKQQKILTQEYNSLKKLKHLHKSCSNLWDSIKKKQNQKMEVITNNKKKVARMNKEKIKKLVNNQNHNLKAIEKYKKKVQHGIMLKQELRKLKEQDILQAKERNKRLHDLKKEQVIEKQIKSMQHIKSEKQMQEIMQKRMVEETVRDLKCKNDIAELFLGMVKGTISPIKKNKLGINVSADLLKKEEEESD